MNRAYRIILGVVAGLVIGTMAQAADKPKDKKVIQSDLPVAVQTTATRESAGATVKGYSQETENGVTIYEMEMVSDGHAKDVFIGTDGVVVSVEEEISWTKLPADVQAGFKQQAGKGTIGKVNSVQKNGTITSYEAKLDTKGKMSEISTNVEGKPLPN